MSTSSDDAIAQSAAQVLVLHLLAALPPDALSDVHAFRVDPGNGATLSLDEAAAALRPVPKPAHCRMRVEKGVAVLTCTIMLPEEIAAHRARRQVDETVGVLPSVRHLLRRDEYDVPLIRIEVPTRTGAISRVVSFHALAACRTDYFPDAPRILTSVGVRDRQGSLVITMSELPRQLRRLFPSR